MTSWQLKAWIPNTHGYPLTVKLKDGSTARTRVVRAPETGLHSVEGVVWADVTGWRP